jgi:hypothetical protein
VADLSNAQKAPLLIGGDAVASDTPGIASTDPAIASIAPFDGEYWVVGQAPGSTTVTASYAGRSGSLEVTVSAEPLVLTLGPAEPK